MEICCCCFPSSSCFFLITSEMKVRSLGLLTLGTTMVVRLGDFNYTCIPCQKSDRGIRLSAKLTTSVKSPNARPLLTELMRTARSRNPGGISWSNALRTKKRASFFRCSATLSSRSYATQSTAKERDLSRKRCEDPGTIFGTRISLWLVASHSLARKACNTLRISSAYRREGHDVVCSELPWLCGEGAGLDAAIAHSTDSLQVTLDSILMLPLSHQLWAQRYVLASSVPARLDQQSAGRRRKRCRSTHPTMSDIFCRLPPLSIPASSCSCSVDMQRSVNCGRFASALTKDHWGAAVSVCLFAFSLELFWAAIMDHPQQGELNWRLSAHPITLLVFLGFRIGRCNHHSLTIL